jgi:hypothetical protein
MPQIQLRLISRTSSPGDITATVSDKTFDYLLSSDSDKIRVSAYLDRDWDRVDPNFQELFISEASKDEFKIQSISPGSKTRWSITLPDAMKEGEQLTLQVLRVVKE